eukprot:TRINITY_DN22903_c0_g1_i1.p1 TRINITY_DN22903_c0_g1~~TRINITY_DN22903_c0_g1_i1.p1  ORF type:complete len:422 (-),score=79.01 TRINITY_DN22903_c0_g1_i1:51-1316(-)
MSSKPLLPKAAAKAAGKRKEEGCFDEGSLASSVALLCSAGIGTGVLALPYAFSIVGVIPALSLFVIAGVASYLSNTILCKCVHKTGVGTYGGLMQQAIGESASSVLDAFVCLEGLGAVATYLVFIMDYVPQLCSLYDENAWCTDRTGVALAASLIIWPLSCFEGLSALRYVSTCSLLTMLFTCIVVVAKAPSQFAALERPVSSAVMEMKIHSGGFQVISIACFAYMTHTNTPEIAQKLQAPSDGRFGRMVGAQTLIMTVGYVLIAVSGYLSFLDGTSQDFLTNYELGDLCIIASRVLLSWTLIFACPINICPGIQSLFNILDRWQTRRTGGGADQGLYSKASIRIPVTTACFAFSLGVALRTPHVADLISTLSAFLSAPLMFAFPALMYFKILGGEDFVVPGMLIMLTVTLWLAELYHFIA